MEISSFWAKTSHDNINYPNAFHPLICHLIDVGIAAQTLWENVLPRITKARIAAIFGFQDNENDLRKAGNLIAFLIGLHDLGKCSPPFALRGEYDKLNWKNKQTVRLLELYRDANYFRGGFKSASDAPHNFVTSVVLPPILEEKFAFKKPLATDISNIIGGHHGTFPDNGYLTKNTGDIYCGDKNWRKSQREFVEILAEIFNVEGDFSHLQADKFDNATAMIFAGLTTVADWIGSNADFFECEVKDSTKPFQIDNRAYLKESRAKVDEALKTLGWSNWVRETDEKNFDDLFPHLTDTRHLQSVAVRMAKQNELDSAGIAIIESPMGEGKTEAAMYLADVWNAKLGTRGIYFALPTQATSNQMFGRIAEFLEARFKSEELNVQYMLQHGHSSISAEFADTMKNFRNIQNISDDAEKSNGGELSNIAAAEWFTYKKRGLLVPFGVGTIDQILLAVLQTKHVFVRLFGLANKTIIIDEVHAYDSYMSTLLERLIEWLAALGSPVVILSATLPKTKRDALIKAYQTGLGQKFEEGEKPRETGAVDYYPRISYATKAMDDKTFKIERLETSPQNTKTLYLEWKNENDFVRELKAKLAGGGCAAIICNTVDRAQTLAGELIKDDFFKGAASDGLPKLDLLHARFRFLDRDAREKRSLARFAKPDANGEDAHRPHTAVLIATQIIEQSLDLDFDLMITELAPADLILQRAGRLQRHHNRTRPPAFKSDDKDKPTLWIIKPETDGRGDLLIGENGSPKFGKSGFVYDKHILFRSWLKLKDETQIEIPGGIEDLIEAVYDDEKVFSGLTAIENAVWLETLKSYQTDCENEKEQAKSRYVKHPHYTGHLGRLLGEPKEEDAPEIHPAHQAATRLVEPTANVVCLWEKDGRIYTDENYKTGVSLSEKPNKEMTKQLLFNSITVSSKSVVFELLQNEIPTGWKQSSLLMRHRALTFDAERKCEAFGYEFHLDENLGLRIKKIKDSK